MSDFKKDPLRTKRMDAVGFISIAVGEIPTSHSDTMIWWELGPKEARYTVELSDVGDTLGVQIDWASNLAPEIVKNLYAVIGYAHYHGFLVTWN